MALKHRCEFTDLRGDGWFILIYDEEYGGTTSFEFAVGPTGFELTWEGDINDRSVAIIPSRVSIPMMLQNGNDTNLVDNLATGYEGRYFVEIYYRDPASPVLASAHLFWRGILLPDLTEFVDEFYPQEVQLTAVDDLANLKNIPFKFDPDATGYVKFKGIIANALNKLRPWTITADTHRYTAVDYLRVYYGLAGYGSPLTIAELNYNRYKDDTTNPPIYQDTYSVLEEVLSAIGARLYWHAGIDDDSGFIVDSVLAHQYDDDLLTGFSVNSGGTATATTVTRDAIALSSTNYKRAAGWMRGYLNPLQRVERKFEYGGSGPFAVDHLYDFVDSDNYLDGTSVTIFTAASQHYNAGTPVSLRFKFRVQSNGTDLLSIVRMRLTVKLNLGQYYARRAMNYEGYDDYFVGELSTSVLVATFSESPAEWSTNSAHRLEFITPPMHIGGSFNHTFEFGIDMPGLPAGLTSEDCAMSFESELVHWDNTDLSGTGVYLMFSFGDAAQEIRDVNIYPTDIYGLDGATVTFQAVNDEPSANEVLQLPDVGFSDKIGSKGGGITVEVGGDRTKPEDWHSLAATGTDYNLHNLITREWLLGQSRNIRKQRGTVHHIQAAPSGMPSFLHTYVVDTVKYALYTLTFRAATREWDVEMLELSRAGTITTPQNGLSGALPEVPGLPPIYTTSFTNAEVNDEVHNDNGEIFSMFING